MIDIKYYDFELPKDLIAQEPIEPRDKARLMILKGETIVHRYFYEIIDEFDKGDLLIVNNSKVIPSRIYGNKSTGGKIEALFIRDMSNKIGEKDLWLVILKGHGLKPGVKLIFKGKDIILEGEICEWVENGKFLVKFYPKDKSIRSILNKIGIIALPPYIKKKFNDYNIYQTVYSKVKGSIAAPTAGLHFTRKLLKDLKLKGVELCYLTLHISASSFVPVEQNNINKSPLDPEFYSIPDKTIKLYNKAVSKNSNIFIVGTTTMKALESACDENGLIIQPEGFSDLFISPGYKFKSKVSRFITNFHTPKSPPLLMVSAFYGWNKLKRAYQVAIDRKYRFYSFGDAMLIYRP